MTEEALAMDRAHTVAQAVGLQILMIDDSTGIWVAQAGLPDQEPVHQAQNETRAGALNALALLIETDA
jgi:hypothetical protein